MKKKMLFIFFVVAMVVGTLTSCGDIVLGEQGLTGEEYYRDYLVFGTGAKFDIHFVDATTGTWTERVVALGITGETTVDNFTYTWDVMEKTGVMTMDNGDTMDFSKSGSDLSVYWDGSWVTFYALD